MTGLATYDTGEYTKAMSVAVEHAGYDALRAGRCLDAPQLHLEPVPLLVGDDGLVKVALTAAA